MRKIHSAIALLLLSSFMAGCNQAKMETGDFIFDKQINQDNTPMIVVVQNISRNDASNHSLSDYLNNDDPNDVIYYLNFRRTEIDLKACLCRVYQGSDTLLAK